MGLIPGYHERPSNLNFLLNLGDVNKYRKIKCNTENQPNKVGVFKFNSFIFH